MAAVIGALRVDLGLNSAEFQAGLKKASVGLGNFAKTAGAGFAAVAAAAAVAGAALGVAVKNSIDNADRMGELAQQVGVSVEALTSLGYAAKLSGSDTDTLATGLRKLSQNMLTIAQGGTGPVAAAFTALGVSAQNANGSLRSADEVLIDVADRFARMEDGATKTALAVQLFGRSGAELIPFLNQGREGIGALTAEADRLGITISGTTANAAGQFNDTLDRLQATFSGVINQIAAGMLPALNEFGAKLADPQFAASAQAIGVAIVNSMKIAVDSINTVVGAFAALQNSMSWLNNNDMFGNPIDRGGGGKGLVEFNTPEQATQLLKDRLAAGQTSGPGADFYTAIFGAPAAEVAASAQQVATAFEPVIQNTQAAAAGASALSAAMTEGKAVFEATRTPAETYGLEVERLNRLLQQGAIDQDTYNRAVTQAQDAFQQAEMSGNQLASTLSSGLANVFSSVVDGSKSAVDAVGDLLKSLGQLLINQAFTSLIGGAFGGGKGGGFLGGLFGFAQGGSFQVGGSGGIDSQLVAFKASPNEHVSITKPGQERGGGGAIAVDVTVGVQDGALVPLITQVSGQVAGQQIKANNKQLPNLIADVNMRQG